MAMTSCYTCTGSCTSSVTHVSGTYTGIGADDSDYTYDEEAFTAGSCNLDIAGGGHWCLVSGVWCLMSGVWCLVSGVWCLVSGV